LLIVYYAVPDLSIRPVATLLQSSVTGYGSFFGAGSGGFFASGFFAFQILINPFGSVQIQKNGQMIRNAMDAIIL
jgi:hypothetical protein